MPINWHDILWPPFSDCRDPMRKSGPTSLNKLSASPGGAKLPSSDSPDPSTSAGSAIAAQSGAREARCRQSQPDLRLRRQAHKH